MPNRFTYITPIYRHLSAFNIQICNIWIDIYILWYTVHTYIHNIYVQSWFNIAFLGVGGINFNPTTITVSHITLISRKLFIMSANEAKTQNLQWCRMSEENQEVCWRVVCGMCELLPKILWKTWEQFVRRWADLSSSGQSHFIRAPCFLSVSVCVRVCVCVHKTWRRSHLPMLSRNESHQI